MHTPKTKLGQQQRLFILLGKYCTQEDGDLSDSTFVQEIVRRWGRDTNRLVSIGVDDAR